MNQAPAPSGQSNHVGAVPSDLPKPAAPLVVAGVPGGALLAGDAFRMALEPTTLAEAFNVASIIASCRICGCETAEDALVRILTGRSLGLTTMQSLRGIYVVKGRPGIDATLMHAICIASPVCEYFDLVSSDEKQATYKAKRRGGAERVWTFTIEDAERAGLLECETPEKTKLSAWYKNPRDMLRARCKSTLARMEFPDLMFGMFTPDEIATGAADERPNEMVGEVVPNGPGSAPGAAGTAPAAAPTPPSSPVNVAPRDYQAEVAAIKVQIQAAATKELRTAVRKTIARWDGPPFLLKQLQDEYNAFTKANPLPAAPANDAPATPPPAPGSSPAPEGGNGATS
jgi:hypothetical protein